jgi:hypothetical protein
MSTQPKLSPEAIEQSLRAPENCVMHQYPDGQWGWRFDPVKFHRLQRMRKAMQLTIEEASHESLEPPSS